MIHRIGHKNKSRKAKLTLTFRIKIIIDKFMKVVFGTFNCILLQQFVHITSSGQRVPLCIYCQIYKREREVWQDHLTLLRHSWWASAGVMVDQREALAVSTELTDTVYLVRPTGIWTVNPWVSKQQPCILPLGYLVIG